MIRWKSRSKRRRSKHAKGIYLPLRFEMLEERTLLAIVVDTAADTLDFNGASESRAPVHLVVTGTSNNDVITIEHDGGETIVIKNGFQSVYADIELLSISVQAGAGDDVINVNGTPSLLEVDVLAGDGNDTIHVGAGDVASNRRGPIQVKGQDGDDQLVVNDLLNTGNNSIYLLNQTTFTKRFWLGEVGGLTYENVEELSLTANELDNFISIENLAATHLTVFGAGGDDRFIIGGGDFDLGIQADIHVVGGGGSNELIIDDRTAHEKGLALRDYTVDTTTDDSGNEVGRFYKQQIFPPNKFPEYSQVLTFSQLDTVRVQGDDRDSDFRIFSTLPDTDYIFDGNDGMDHFRVSAAGLASDVTINGNDPNSGTGDSLHIVGTPDFSAEYTPRAQNEHSGAVVTNGHSIRFTGLEPKRQLDTFTRVAPVRLENFGTLTVFTPRSYDAVYVTAESSDWTRISGSSGGVRSGSAPVYLPFRSLEFRDVRNVTLDVARHDQDEFDYYGLHYFPYPFSDVTLQEGALNARGLESFSVKTASGFNQVFDNTLTDGAGTNSKLTVSRDTSVPGATLFFINGMAAHGEVEQFTGLHSTAKYFDSAGIPRHDIELNGVDIVYANDPIPFFRAIGDGVDRRFSGTSRQIISGEGLTPFSITPSDENSKLEIVALGRSNIELFGVTSADASISGLRYVGPQPEPPSSPDEITVRFTDFYAVGPQPEPPRMRVVRVVGYDPEDTFNVQGLIQTDGTPLDTAFGLAFDSAEKTILVDGGLANFPGVIPPRARFIIETGDMGAGPELGLIGDPSVSNSIKTIRPAAIDLGMDHPLPVFLTGIETFNLTNSTDGEGLDVRMLQDGMLGIDSVNLLDQGRDLYFVADQQLTTIQVDDQGGEDVVAFEYGMVNRVLATDLQGIEAIEVAPDPAIDLRLLSPARQSFTPTSGSVSTGNFLLTHDDAVTTTKVDWTNIELLVSPDRTGVDTFTRDVSLNYRYLGSEGKDVINDVIFKKKFELNVVHKDGTTNTTTIQEQDVVYEQATTTTITGADGGEDKILVTKTGVESQKGSKLEIDLKNGKDIVVVTESDSSQDELIVKGQGDPQATDDTKTILYYKKKLATAESQLDELKVDKPEYADEIEILKTRADQIVIKKPATKPAAGKTAINYEGDQSKLDLYVKNLDSEPVEATIKNTGGTTQVEKVGNVDFSVPDLDGTGIDPTQLFTTFVVTNTNDSGEGSLRAAIDAANAFTADGLAVITFNIPMWDPGAVDLDGEFESQSLLAGEYFADPSVNADGTLITFTSDADLTGANSDGSTEVFLIDVTTGNIRQISDSANPSTISDRAKISADGSHVVFLSNVDSQSGQFESDVYLADLASGEVTQVTHATTTAGNSYIANAKISADGGRIGFLSDLDLDPLADNSEAAAEVFLYEVATGRFTQLTDSPAPERSTWMVDMNADGTRFAFTSKGDFDPAVGNADGDIEAFLYDHATGSFTQITNTTGGSYYKGISISGDGNRVGILTREDLDPDVGNSEGFYEFYIFDASSGITQLTNIPADAEGGNSGHLDFASSLDATGERVAFLSGYDYTGENPTSETQSFLYDSATGRFTQLSKGNLRQSFRNGSVQLSADGSTAVFVAQNEEGELHLFRAAATPDVFVISPLTELPALTRGNIVINGQSQQNATTPAEVRNSAFQFTGHITSVDASLSDSFMVGEPVTMKIDFDRMFPDTNPDDHIGRYFTVPSDPADFGAVSQLTATFGGYSLHSPDGAMEVLNDFTNSVGFTFDRFLAGASDSFGLVGLPVGTYVPQAAEVLLIDETSGAFDSDALPTSLDLNSIPTPANRRIDFLFRGPGGEAAFVRGEITEIKSEFSSGTPVVTGTIAGDTNPFGPEIVLAGTFAGVDADGLQITSSNNHVHGLNIQQFDGDGVQISAAGNNTLTGNYIGTNAMGNAATELPGIVSWWSGEGTADDRTGNHDGSLANGTTFAPGKVGQAFSFDGLDDVLTTPLVVDYSGGVTFDAWVKTTDGAGAIMSGDGGRTAGRGMGLFVHPGGFVGLGGTNETPGVPNFDIVGPVISDGVFHHVAAVWTGDTSVDGARLYVDGVLVGTGTAHGAIMTDSDLLHIGGHASLGYHKLAGLIDEPTVYNRVLSDAEIRSIHERGSAGKTADAGNGGDGVWIVDSSGNIIGGLTESARNVISGNTTGVTISGSQSVGNHVIGNFIGTDATGTSRISNADGVALRFAATGNDIGGTEEGLGT